MIQPPFGRGFAACEGASVGSVSVAAVVALAGSVPSTPGRAPGGGGGRASGAGAAACSLGRARPANGMGVADADFTVPLDFTLNVFTVTGWIGSLDPGVARCDAVGAVAGRSSCTGKLVELARSKCCASVFSDLVCASAAAVLCTAAG